MTRILTPEAQADRDNFDSEESGCTCFLSPPCGHCTHPGNPLNQEVDECWHEPKEHGILFKGPLVLKIMAGDKTQTRRVVKMRKDSTLGCELAPHELAGEINQGRFENSKYKPGERLWVRETFALSVRDPDGGPPEDDPDNYDVMYQAGYEPGGGWTDGQGNAIKPPWKPSIHMWRWACRLVLEITDVRVEKLHDISEADAKAEGAPDYEEGVDAPPDDENAVWSYHASFLRLWESINGYDSMVKNPWVYVITFKEVDQ